MMDDRPGIVRMSEGDGFAYYAPGGERIVDEKELVRIRALAVPPAWNDVWIAPSPRAHLQATGRDARGRKQYRYHPRWREARDDVKYGRMARFGNALPAIRKRLSEHLALPGLPRDKVLAAVVRLLEETMIRIGNAEYARANKSFGLTTLRDRHVSINGSTARFSFRGKSGVKHALEINDRRLARIVKRCQDLPGQDLFQYVGDDGVGHPIGSADVNDYLRGIAGDEYTAKDVRTWGGTVAALEGLRTRLDAATITERRHHIVDVVKSVASLLGNTPAVCRKCYIHPRIVSAYEDGSLAAALPQLEKLTDARPDPWLTRDEQILRELLKHQ